MDWNFKELQDQAKKDAGVIKTEAELEEFRVRYLGRKGIVQDIFSSMSTLSGDQKPLVGKGANDLRALASALLEEKKAHLSNQKPLTENDVDITLPGVPQPAGHHHLISQTIQDICLLFERMGFVVQDGPEIETEFNNFEALNIPVDHPSRDAFDTFYVDLKDPRVKGKNQLLRSHTSPGQIRIMQAHQPPLAVIIPGKVYRPDAVDASHSFMFHQIEGLLVDKDVTFADLKGLLTMFCKKFFGQQINMRFRPHFFPFTEPSAEVDISWKEGKKDWLEIMGCGMVHPNVFAAAGYPKGKYKGLAFGLGVDRIAMLKHGIKDIRVLYENDQRFLNQF